MSLARKLGFWDIFCIATGAMISSGLFILPGQAFKISGPGVVLAYALAALMVIPAMLSKAELATAMPKSGGDYFFIERSMGATKWESGARERGGGATYPNHWVQA